MHVQCVYLVHFANIRLGRIVSNALFFLVFSFFVFGSDEEKANKKRNIRWR